MPSDWDRNTNEATDARRAIEDQAAVERYAKALRDAVSAPQSPASEEMPEQMPEPSERKTIVLAGPSKWRRSFFPNDVRVGWRIVCEDGSLYDMFWGSCPPARLEQLLANARIEHGDVAVCDLRDFPDDVRDRLWFDATQRARTSPSTPDTGRNDSDE